MSVGVSKLAHLASASILILHHPMQDEGFKARLQAIEAFQKIPGIGYVFLTYCYTPFS
jgi:hypothetical protein